MAKFDRWSDGSDQGGDGAPTPAVKGGLLDPRTFPSPWPPATDFPSVDPQPSKTGRASDSDLHAEVLKDILNAQAKLPPIPDVALDRPPPLVNGPLMTDPHPEVLQNFMNALAGLRPVPPHPETWSINGQPYLAISAGGFDPSRSNGVTSMPTPADSAAAFAGRKQFAVRDGDAEKVGYIAHSPSSVVPVTGKVRTTDRATTVKYNAPAGSPRIHGHIDGGPYRSDGMVDNTEEFEGYGDTVSFGANPPVPTATVSHGQVGWHVLDNGQLKFLYPPGSMDSSQIGQMQKNLGDEQKKFLRPKRK